MKQKNIFLCMGLSILPLLSSCTSEDQGFDLAPDTQGEQKTGAIVLSLDANTRFSSQTRAVNEASYSNTADYTVQLFNNDSPTDLIVNCKYSELGNNMPVSFAPGTYTVKAFYGQDISFSRDVFYVEGSNSNVTVNVGGKTDVRLSCLPTCGKLSVSFDQEMSTYYDSYDVSFAGAEVLGGSALSWAATDTEPWYVKLSPAGETLTYTIHLTAKDQYAYTDAQGNKKTNGTVTKEFQLQRNRAYKLNIKPDYTAMTEGGLSITIEIDEGVDQHDISVVVPVDWL